MVRRRRIAAAVGFISLGMLGGMPGCQPSVAPVPTPRSGATILVSSEPPPTPTPTPEPVASPTASLLPPTGTAAPASTVPPSPGRGRSSADGAYVTSALPRARYYYPSSDQRWKTIEQPVWFRTLDELLSAYPGRQPAP